MKKRWSFPWCLHRASITTITAGLAREVCEACGQVKVRYVENAVQVFNSRPRYFMPQAPDAPHRPRAVLMPDACLYCRQMAVYSIPDGEVCEEHAWQAAARLDWDRADIWVPIRIDRSTA